MIFRLGLHGAGGDRVTGAALPPSWARQEVTAGRALRGRVTGDAAAAVRSRCSAAPGAKRRAG